MARITKGMVPPNFSKRVVRVRLDLTITQYELASALGVGYRTVQAWEMGQRRPSPRFLRKFLVFEGTIKDQLKPGLPTS